MITNELIIIYELVFYYYKHELLIVKVVLKRDVLNSFASIILDATFDP